MKRFRAFFLLSLCLFFLGDFKKASFVWAGGGMSKQIGDEESPLPRRRVQEEDSDLEKAFKAPDDLCDRLRKYIFQSEAWRLQKEKGSPVIEVFYRDKTGLVLTSLTDEKIISQIKKNIGKTLVPTINLLTFLPKATGPTIDHFFKKVEEDLNGMKTSSTVHKTLYMKPLTKSNSTCYEFLILNGAQRALRIQYTPHIFDAP